MAAATFPPASSPRSDCVPLSSVSPHRASARERYTIACSCGRSGTTTTAGITRWRFPRSNGACGWPARGRSRSGSPRWPRSPPTLIRWARRRRSRSRARRFEVSSRARRSSRGPIAASRTSPSACVGGRTEAAGCRRAESRGCCQAEADGGSEAEADGRSEAEGQGESQGQAEGQGEEGHEPGQGQAQGQGPPEAPPLVGDRQLEERGGVDACCADVSPEVEVWPRRATGGADGADGLTTVHPVTVGDRGLLEVEVERVETQSVVDHDQTAWEEEVRHERDTAVVDGDHRRPGGSAEVY